MVQASSIHGYGRAVDYFSRADPNANPDRPEQYIPYLLRDGLDAFISCGGYYRGGNVPAKRLATYCRKP